MWIIPLCYFDYPFIYSNATYANPSNKSLVSPPPFLVINGNFLSVWDNANRATSLNCFVPQAIGSRCVSILGPSRCIISQGRYCRLALNEIFYSTLILTFYHLKVNSLILFAVSDMRWIALIFTLYFQYKHSHIHLQQHCSWIEIKNKVYIFFVGDE